MKTRQNRLVFWKDFSHTGITEQRLFCEHISTTAYNQVLRCSAERNEATRIEQNCSRFNTL